MYISMQEILNTRLSNRRGGSSRRNYDLAISRSTVGEKRLKELAEKGYKPTHTERITFTITRKLAEKAGFNGDTYLDFRYDRKGKEGHLIAVKRAKGVRKLSGQGKKQSDDTFGAYIVSYPFFEGYMLPHPIELTPIPESDIHVREGVINFNFKNVNISFI